MKGVAMIQSEEAVLLFHKWADEQAMLRFDG
jgi:hypothetical protein